MEKGLVGRRVLIFFFFFLLSIEPFTGYTAGELVWVSCRCVLSVCDK